MIKLMMSTGQIKKLIAFFDRYEDDQVKLSLDNVKGIRVRMNYETNLKPYIAADHCKAVFKKTKAGKVLHFSIVPDGAY